MMGETKTNRLYDIHCHAFNLSHAGLIAFLNRFLLNNSMSLKDLIKGKFLKILKRFIFGELFNLKSFLRILFLGLYILAIFGETLLLILFLRFLNWDIFELSKLTLVILFILAVLCLTIVNALLLFQLYRSKVSQNTRNIINLLSLMENDIGRQLLYIELDLMELDSRHKGLAEKIKKNYMDEKKIDEVRRQWQRLDPDEKGFEYDGQIFNKLVLTPLMMDFGYYDFDSLQGLIPYDLPPRKPIITQLVDLYNGICNYRRTTVFNLLEIRPFLGINTRNYALGPCLKVGPGFKVPSTLHLTRIYLMEAMHELLLLHKLSSNDLQLLKSENHDFPDVENVIKKLIELNEDAFGDDGQPVKNCIPKMMIKYFGTLDEEIPASPDSFIKELSQFKTERIDINTTSLIPRHFFLGVKVYPPLGFDPWPDPKAEPNENKKVRFLYDFCNTKRIPITTHCSEIAFVVIARKLADKYCDPESWKTVLENYPDLKLNFAHFGSQAISRKRTWFKKILQLIKAYPNVYADFSFLERNEKYFKKFISEIDDFVADPANGCNYSDVEAIYDHTLFGTDFAINLIKIESYRKYLEDFSKINSFSNIYQKEKFYADNPEHFLF